MFFLYISLPSMHDYDMSMTLLGKITIIKTLTVSFIVYILSSLPTPPDILKTINSILYDFLWDGNGDKIKRTTMINNYAKGGLKMLDIRAIYTRKNKTRLT